jgi:diguanylate cyclase (GGDEF)-like protein
MNESPEKLREINNDRLAPALDVVSSRFADLILQEQQQRQLDEIEQKLGSSQTERELADGLMTALARSCGMRKMTYLICEAENQYRALSSLGLPGSDGSDESPILLTIEGIEPLGAHRSLIDVQELEAASASMVRSFSGKTMLPLCLDQDVLAVIILDRRPTSPSVRNYLIRLAARASQSLSRLRMRNELNSLREMVGNSEPSRMVNLNWVEDWTAVINRLEDRFRQLDDLLSASVRTMSADKGSLMLLDDATNELVVRAVYGIDSAVAERVRRGEEPCLRLRMGEGVAGKVAQSLQPMIVNQVDREPLFLEPQLSKVNSILCLPLHVGGLVLGVLNLTNKTQGKRFNLSHVDEGMRLATQAAQAINNSRIYHLAVLDHHTEVFTRAHLHHRIQDEIVRARRYQRNLSFLAITIEGLSPLRSEAGHEQANQVELLVAKLLQDAVRETDSVARLNLDSFGVLLPETDSLSAMFVAERIHQEALKIDLLRDLKLEPHIGICSFPDRAENALQLVARAEAAMAAAGRCGSNIPVYLTPAMGIELDLRENRWAQTA